MASVVHNAAYAETAERSIELLLEPYLTPSKEKRKALTESQIRQVSDGLRRMQKDSWSRVPRLYLVLRLVEQVQVIDAFIAQGVSDIWFPFSLKTLPDALRSPSSRFEFLEVQDLVLTKAFDLEREDGKHRHFSKAEDVPMRKVEELGKGGFGFVDRVVSTITYKEYARKLIPRGRTFKKNMEVLKDFERELGHLKKLSHIHIVELIGSYTDPKFVGIIMSPVAEYNLKDFLSHVQLPTGTRSFLRTFFGCLAAALCYLHDNQIRHKDIKPQNILVKGHQIFLTDFGISLDWSELGQSTTTGVTIKTPRYCAPEVAEYMPRNSFSDMWSLGCVFLEIWTALKGVTIAALFEYLETHGSKSTCYYLNRDASVVWCRTLETDSGPEDNPPLPWILGMMQPDQNVRWTARKVMDEIREVNEDPDRRFAFSGHCCIEDDDSTESATSSKRSSQNLEETGASSIGVYHDTHDGAKISVDASSSHTVRIPSTGLSAVGSADHVRAPPPLHVADLNVMSSIADPVENLDVANASEIAGAPDEISRLSRARAPPLPMRGKPPSHKNSNEYAKPYIKNENEDDIIESNAEFDTDTASGEKQNKKIESQDLDSILDNELLHDGAIRSNLSLPSRGFLATLVTSPPRDIPRQLSESPQRALQLVPPPKEALEYNADYDPYRYNPSQQSMPSPPMGSRNTPIHVKSKEDEYSIVASARLRENETLTGSLETQLYAQEDRQNSVSGLVLTNTDDESTMRPQTLADANSPSPNIRQPPGGSSGNPLSAAIATTDAQISPKALVRSSGLPPPTDWKPHREFSSSKADTTVREGIVGTASDMSMKETKLQQAPSQPAESDSLPIIGQSNAAEPQQIVRQDKPKVIMEPSVKVENKEKDLIKTCGVCSKTLTGQFVRALEGTYHLNCFKCQDCGEVVATKFFPVDNESGNGKYPLCEMDYFRRLDLVCHTCGEPLRGSYITALGHKYHIDHFRCKECHLVFGATDSYYEHDGAAVCRYHYYSFAMKCTSCKLAILKQFVEIFRNGENQHWHPECYMIHKFWNVRLIPPEDSFMNSKIISERKVKPTPEERTTLEAAEDIMEKRSGRIWTVMSTFEENAAKCISDILLHVTNQQRADFLVVSQQFLFNLSCLFGALDRLNALLLMNSQRDMSYTREAKLLCKKFVATLLCESKVSTKSLSKATTPNEADASVSIADGTGAKSHVTQEVLSLTTGLAHYLKLLIRIGLQGSLRLENGVTNSQAISLFLERISFANEQSVTEPPDIRLADPSSDCCQTCGEPIDTACIRFNASRWHEQCLICYDCNSLIATPGLKAWVDDEKTPPRVYCDKCNSLFLNQMRSDGKRSKHLAAIDTGPLSGGVKYLSLHESLANRKRGLVSVLLLEQYVFLLMVATARHASSVPSSYQPGPLRVEKRPVDPETRSDFQIVNNSRGKPELENPGHLTLDEIPVLVAKMMAGESNADYKFAVDQAQPKDNLTTRTKSLGHARRASIQVRREQREQAQRNHRSRFPNETEAEIRNGGADGFQPDLTGTSQLKTPVGNLDHLPRPYSPSTLSPPVDDATVRPFLEYGRLTQYELDEEAQPNPSTSYDFVGGSRPEPGAAQADDSVPTAILNAYEGPDTLASESSARQNNYLRYSNGYYPDYDDPTSEYYGNDDDAPGGSVEVVGKGQSRLKQAVRGLFSRKI